MPREARLNASGTFHHVMPQNIERDPLFRDEQDRDELVARPWQTRIAH